MHDPTDTHLFQQLIARFANSFDLKDWVALGTCLADELHADYSDLRGTPPEILSRERFVELRQSALQTLRTHHLSGNVEITIIGATAAAKVSMVIFRRNETGEALDTHCLYALGFERASLGWVINSIVQKVFLSDGQTAIHRGVLKS